MHSILSCLGPFFMVLGPHPLDLCVRPLPGVTADAYTPQLAAADRAPRTKNRPSAMQVSPSAPPTSMASPGRVLSEGALCYGGVCGAHAPRRKRGLRRWGQGGELHTSPPAACAPAGLSISKLVVIGTP